MLVCVSVCVCVCVCVCARVYGVRACTVCVREFVRACVCSTHLDSKVLRVLAEDWCILWFCFAFLLRMLMSRETKYSTKSILRRLYKHRQQETTLSLLPKITNVTDIRTRTWLFVAFTSSSSVSTTEETIITRLGTVAFTETFPCATFAARRARRKH